MSKVKSPRLITNRRIYGWKVYAEDRKGRLYTLCTGQPINDPYAAPWKSCVRWLDTPQPGAPRFKPERFGLLGVFITTEAAIRYSDVCARRLAQFNGTVVKKVVAEGLLQVDYVMGGSILAKHVSLTKSAEVPDVYFVNAIEIEWKKGGAHDILRRN